MMKKFLLPLIDKSFSFSPKKLFQILCEQRGTRRELVSSNLHFPNWRRGWDSLKYNEIDFRASPEASFALLQGEPTEPLLVSAHSLK